MQVGKPGQRHMDLLYMLEHGKLTLGRWTEEKALEVKTTSGDGDVNWKGIVDERVNRYEEQ